MSDSAPDPVLAWLLERVSSRDRVALAGREDLPRPVQDALVSVADLDVARHLAVNYSLHESALARLADRFRELSAIISLNPSAPIEMIERVPIGDHVPLTIERYLLERKASASQRASVWRTYETSPHPGGDVLGDVWSSAEGSAR